MQAHLCRQFQIIRKCSKLGETVDNETRGCIVFGHKKAQKAQKKIRFTITAAGLRPMTLSYHEEHEGHDAWVVFSPEEPEGQQGFEESDSGFM